MIYELYFSYQATEASKSYKSSTFHTDWNNALHDFSLMARNVADRLPDSDVPRDWGHQVNCGKWGELDFSKGEGHLTLPSGADYIWKIKKFKDDTAYYQGEEMQDER